MWAESAYPSDTPEITPSFWKGSCCLVFRFFYVVSCVLSFVWLAFFSSLGVRRPSSLTFIKIFSSKTTAPNLTKLGHNHHLGSSLKNVSGDSANQPRWPPWLKIEHRGKIQFLAYNSKTKAFKPNMTWGQNCLSGEDLCREIFRWIGQPIVRLMPLNL